MPTTATLVLQSTAASIARILELIPDSPPRLRLPYQLRRSLRIDTAESGARGQYDVWRARTTAAVGDLCAALAGFLKTLNGFG